MINKIRLIPFYSKLLLIFPLIINGSFVLLLRQRMGDAFIQLTDSSIFTTKIESVKELGQLWLFSDFGNRNLVETTNFYSRIPSYILLSLGVPAQNMQLLLYFFALTLIFYVSWLYLYKTIKLVNAGSNSMLASLIAAAFYTYNIQMALFWGGGLGEAMYIFLACVPIFTYEIYKALKTGLTTTSVIKLAIIMGINANVIPFNLAAFGLMTVCFIISDNISRIFKNASMMFVALILSLLVGAIFVYPIMMLYIFPDPYISIDPLKKFIFATNGINGLMQLFFNWTVKMVWGGAKIFPTINFYANHIGILSTFLIWILPIGIIAKKLSSTKAEYFHKLLTFSFLVIFISILIAKGNQEPFSNFNLSIYKHIRLFGLFRTPDTKFGITVVAILAVFLGYALTATKNTILKIALALAVIIHIAPFFTGTNFIGDSDKTKLIKIPDDYISVAQRINADSDTGYVLIYPGYYYEKFDYKNGYIFSGRDTLGKLVSKPVVYYQYNRILEKSKNALNELAYNIDTVNPGLYSIRYIIVRHDLVSIDTSQKDSLLDKNPNLEKVEKLELVTLYKVKDSSYTDIYSFSSNGKKINEFVTGDTNSFSLSKTFTIPASVVEASDKLELQFNTSYYELLNLESNISSVSKHTLSNSFANLWEITEISSNNKDIEISVTFSLQEYYPIAIAVSIISTLILLLWLLALNYFRSQADIFMRDILFSFICIPLRLISGLIPKDKSSMGFGSWMGKNFSDNPYFFFEYLRSNHPELNIFIISKSDSVIEEFGKKGDEVFHPYSLLGLWKIARAGTLFTTHSVREDFNVATISPSQNVIQFWHGTPVKSLINLGYLRQNKMTILKNIYTAAQRISMIAVPNDTFIVAANEFSQERFVEFFKVDSQKIKILGYPRNDILAEKNTIDRGTYNKILIYLPTYRNKNTEASPIMDHLKEINIVLEKHNYLLLIKPHPAVANSVNLGKLSHIKTQFEILGTNDAQVGMASADVLITDYSGLLYDFALTNRPYIFFPYDYTEYSKSPGLCIDYYRDLPGPFANTIEDLVMLIETIEVWSNNKDYIVRCASFRNRFHKYKDANSSVRIYNYLVKRRIINASI